MFIANPWDEIKVNVAHLASLFNSYCRLWMPGVRTDAKLPRFT
jgi:hypothetical protein